MAELIQKERLQPSLLDRLTDNTPRDDLTALSNRISDDLPLERQEELRYKKENKRQDELKQRFLSLSDLEDYVRRDLAWLLNTSALGSVQDFNDYPLVSHSVINYGIPDLVGTTLSGANVPEIEKLIRQAIWDFEPRILPETVKVKISVQENQMNQNAMTFDIEGDLWAQPLPLHLYLRTVLDLETGNMEVLDRRI